MVIYFTEEDLVSFGEYMVSPQRRQIVKDRPNPDGLSLDERVSSVHEFDLTNWAYLMTNQKQAMAEINNEDKIIN